ncbi:MAG: SpoVR family protein [Halobacteriovoraceae bacterium]|nr:SpoVR family protein [Halobacteriovoraceae bacterium]|tara:strand:- start:8168 stop:9682 length:1515 start_codon:yes stop_codon:yes gene_type:complete
MLRTKPISKELLALQKKVQGHADDFGLDYFPQVFEMCDYDTINILAAQGGFPIRYPHWKFGMDYDQLSKGYRYGMQKIYEMVINTDPCYAYLLEVNNWLDQKLVMCHVYGHNDFFKNNMWFSNTNRKMMDVMANNGSKIRRYMERHGVNKVERFIDRVLSLENLLDMNMLFETQDVKKSRFEKELAFREEQEHGGYVVDDRSSALKSYMRAADRKESLQKLVEDDEASDLMAEKNTTKGMRDILLFLIENAPIEEWQADIIACLRNEAYYFLPQRVTKIMNEGWASYWHSTMMNQKVMDPSEFIEFAKKHAGVMAMSKKNINPYKIGIELFRDIEFRWNTGRFGKEYNSCTDMNAKENWNTKAGLGREKIFEIRRSHNDISFINEFLTPEFCNRQQIFTYKYNPRTQRMEIDTRDFQAIKQKLLSQLTNFGSPIIEVEDANYKNRKELLLKHIHYGVDLDMQFASETMSNLYAIWKRPINLATAYEDKKVIINFDGNEMKVNNT